VSGYGLSQLMIAPAVFAFGLVAFGFLGMGPVTIAVDSYGPVTDNAQSVFELSVIESLPNIKQEIKKDYGFDVNFERAKHLLEETDGAGNTFKATAKPVLIGTAVVGATTMIFSIIVVLTNRLQPEFLQFLSILHPPFLLGLITGGAMIYWFTGASTQAETTGAYRAVEFIKANIRMDGVEKASVALNPVIKFTTLFGLLAVELGVQLARDYGAGLSHVLAAAFILGSAVFVHRSFYGMRIKSEA
jgi:K(+)-stimulated pyrophosphate-energized sodium pump